MDKVMAIFAPHCNFITWTSYSDVYQGLLTHFLDGRSDTMEEFIGKCASTWKSKRSLKLLDGTELKELSHGTPFDNWMRANTNIVIKALSPDIWSTDHESNDMPDFMRIPRFGLFHEGNQDEYMNGTREHRIGAVSKRYGLRSIIKSFDTAPTV